MDNFFSRGFKSTFILLLGIFSINLVSAQPFEFERIGIGIQDSLGAFFGFLLNSSQFDEYFFAKILFLIMLMFLIKTILGTFPPFADKRGVTTIISVVVSLIGVRYLSDLQVVRGILLPYGALAIALTTIIPFIIYFFFVHKSIESGTGRRVAWIFYMIILLGLWFNEFERLNSLSNYIFTGIFILALALIIFDRRVKVYFEMAEAKKAVQNITADQIVKATNDLQEAMNAARAAGGSDRLLNRLVQKRAKYLERLKKDFGSS